MRFTPYILLFALCSLTACGSGKPPSPMMKLGKPYQVDGETYYPEYDSSYDKTGMGSWYGPGFHGKKTANGERFDEKDLTAAHPTLPMPCLVRVTNLKNGKSVIARVNDRGPFKSRRIIDLSRGSAERIGLHSTMKVRVQYLPKETEDYLKNWEKNGEPEDMFAYNDRHDAQETSFAQADAEPQKQPEEHRSRWNLISDAKADDDTSVSPITSSDLPPPSAAKKAPSEDVRPLVSPSSKSTTRTVPAPQPVYERETESVPFSRGPSVPAPQETPESKAPFKEVEPVHPAAPTGEEYYIQAGTFSRKENAQHLTETLSTLSGATMDKIERSGKEMWRVRVGPFINKSAASEALVTVQEHVPDAHISH